MSGMRGSPRNGRSKVRYKAWCLGTNKKFTGHIYIPNAMIADKEGVVFKIERKHRHRNMPLRQVYGLKIVKDTFFL